MDTSSGYVEAVDYVSGYYRIQQPDHLYLACLNAGVAPPGSEAPDYLELGYGMGLTINIHAAAGPGRFWGTDFNTNHATEAKILARASGADVRLLDDSFAELAGRSDLPEFDIIALHGVWSWISAENQRAILDLIRRRLRTGGLVYVSYNTNAGWAAIEPLTHLMALHAEIVGSDASSAVDRVEGAIDFARKVVNSGGLYFKLNPEVAKSLERVANVDRKVFAHQYFSRDRKLMPFSEVADAMGEAKLDFAASVHLLDAFDGMHFTPDGQKLMAGIQNPVLKQSVRDYMVNQHTRCDVFVKGLRRLSPLERVEALQAMSFVATAPADVPLTVRGTLGDLTLQEQIYRPVLEFLAENRHAPKPYREIAEHPRLRSHGRLLEALMVLIGAGHVSTVRTPTAATRAQCKALNRHLLKRAQTGDQIAWLASPVIAAGVSSPRFEQLFLGAIADGRTSPTEQASHAWKLLSAQNQRMTRDGKTLQTADENLRELTRMATFFSQKRLTILRALEVV